MLSFVFCPALSPEFPFHLQGQSEPKCNSSVILSTKWELGIPHP